MLPFDLSALPLAAVIAVFAAAAAAVWLAGTRLSGYVEAISERTGIGAAFLGALVLGGITSLPELATTVSASIAGDADLAVNNLFGGVAMQVAVLAVADAALRSRPLSSSAREPVVLLQGVLLILVLTVAIAGMVVGEPEGWPIGPWAASVLLAAVGSFYLMRRYQGHAAWRPVTREGRLEELERGAPDGAPRTGGRGEGSPEAVGHGEGSPEPGEGASDPRRPLRTLVVLAAVAGLAILVAGVLLARTGEVIASRSGLGSSFVGATLLAGSTSLPEVSTTIAAARLGRYDMAFSNIFGANLLDVGLIGVTDLAYAGSPVLGQMGAFAIFGALLGVAVTAVFLAGLIRRRVRRVGNLGVDSMVVLALYLAGMFVLHRLR